MRMFKRKSHRTSKGARAATEAEAGRRSSILDLISSTQGKVSDSDAEARKQLGLEGGLFMPSQSYNPLESEAKARARGIRAARQGRLDELKRQLGQPVAE